MPFFHRILSPGLMGGILGRLALIGGKFGLEDRLLRLQNEKRQGTEGSTLEREEGTTRESAVVGHRDDSPAVGRVS